MKQKKQMKTNVIIENWAKDPTCHFIKEETWSINKILNLPSN